MNLEPIDTSTTAGKAEVMRLAAEGQYLVTREVGSNDPWEPIHEKDSEWAWGDCDYAIMTELVEPNNMVGPEGVWIVVGAYDLSEKDAKDYADQHGLKAVRYVRPDLAGEQS